MTADIIPFKIERQADGELRISDVENGTYRPDTLTCLDERPSNYEGEVVYFLYGQKTNLTKIGTTKNLLSRLKSLKCGCAEPTKILRITPGGRRLESIFHRAFKARRQTGEWFLFHPAMISALPGESGANIEKSIVKRLEMEHSEKVAAEILRRPGQNHEEFAKQMGALAEANMYGLCFDDVKASLYSTDEDEREDAVRRIEASKAEASLQWAFKHTLNALCFRDPHHAAKLLSDALKTIALHEEASMKAADADLQRKSGWSEEEIKTNASQWGEIKNAR